MAGDRERRGSPEVYLSFFLPITERERQPGCVERGRELPGWSYPGEIWAGATHPRRGSDGRARTCSAGAAGKVRVSSQTPPQSKGLAWFWCALAWASRALQSICFPKKPEASDI